MKKHLASTLMVVLTGLIVVGICMPLAVNAQNLHRLAANSRYFNGEANTSSTSGITIYNKTVFVPTGDLILYVTISATGDAHEGDAILIGCFVDGAACTPGTTSSGKTGYIDLQRHDTVNDFHDNGLYYTWCKKVTGGANHTVTLKLASLLGSGTSGAEVFVEAAHFYIDSASSNVCGSITATATAAEAGAPETPAQ